MYFNGSDVFSFTLQVGKIQNEWLHELYKVSLGFLGLKLSIHTFRHVISKHTCICYFIQLGVAPLQVAGNISLVTSHHIQNRFSSG